LQWPTARDGRPARCTAVGTGEEMVLAAKRDRADRLVRPFVVEFDASIIEEPASRMTSFAIERCWLACGHL